MRDITHLLLRYIKEVKHAIVAHYSQPAIPLVKRDRLDSLIDFDLRETKLTIEILADYFEERKSKHRKKKTIVSQAKQRCKWKGTVFIAWTYPDFLFSPSVFL